MPIKRLVVAAAVALGFAGCSSPDGSNLGADGGAKGAASVPSPDAGPRDASRDTQFSELGSKTWIEAWDAWIAALDTSLAARGIPLIPNTGPFVTTWDSSNYVYRRDFERGIVLINPSASAVTVGLGTTFKRVELAGGSGGSLNTDSPAGTSSTTDVTSIDVPATAAEILLR
jgi:hypothetical protein